MPIPSIGEDKPNEIYIKAFLFVKPFTLWHHWFSHIPTIPMVKPQLRKKGKRGQGPYLIEELHDAEQARIEKK
jgi:hypothetical protein